MMFKLILIALMAVEGTFGAISVTVPLAGDADAQIALPEDTTGALTIETLEAATDVVGESISSYTIVSQDGATSGFLFDLTMAVGGATAVLATLSSTVAATFDYETRPYYKLVIDIVDSTGDTATATVTATLTDIDDNTPSFSLVSTCGAVPALSIAGFAVGTYAASDADGTVAKRTLTYAITGGDDAGSLKFNAVPTGGEIVRTAVPLDPATKSVYSLVLEATSDTTNTGTTTIVVTVGGSCGACGSGSGAQAITSAASILASLLGFMLYQFV